jgi:cytochrome c5
VCTGINIAAFLSLIFSSPDNRAGDNRLKAVFEKKCSTCHKIERATSAKKTNEEWTKTVTRMKGKKRELQ